MEKNLFINAMTIHEFDDLTALIQQLGFLPLLDNPVAGFSAEEMASIECRYQRYNDGSWSWPLWDWKGPAVQNTPCVYGKFFGGRAGFVSLEWWPDLMNYRRGTHPYPAENSVERAILDILELNGAMITRELRKACGFTGPKMRSRFDNYVTRLQMECRIVTEDFVYPKDKQGERYGFGWALLNTPENTVGRAACHCNRTPQASFERILGHFSKILPHANADAIRKLIY